MDKKLNTYFNIISDLPKFALSYTAKLRDKKKLSTVIVQTTEIRAFLTHAAVFHELYRASDLTPSQVENLTSDFLDSYFLSVSPNSRIIKYSYLNMFYLHLMKERLISYNPLWDYEVPTAVSAEKSFVSEKDVTDTLIGISSGLSLSEREATFAGRTQLRDMAVIALLYYSGLSLSECASLSLSDVLIGDDTGESLYQIQELCEKHGVSDKKNLLSSWLMTSAPSGSELYPAFHKEGSLKCTERTTSLRPEASAFLLSYLSELEYFENGPLFYSLRKRRLSERTIEHMVAKHFDRYTGKHVTTYMLSTSYKI